MPLTALKLTVDQKSSGWLERAGLEACALLVREGRPQIAARLAAEFGRDASLSTLRRYLGLHLLEGVAPACQIPVGARGGRLDGRRCSSGAVPRQPQAIDLSSHLPAKANWFLEAGSGLLAGTLSRLDAQHHPVDFCVRRLEIGGEMDIRRAWEATLEGDWRNAASDGTFLATLAATGENVALLRGHQAETGEPLWETTLFGIDPEAPLAVANDQVVVFDPKWSTLMAVQADSGEALWHRATPKVTEGRGLAPRLLLSDQTLVLYGSVATAAFDVATGELRWCRPHKGTFNHHKGMPPDRYPQPNLSWMDEEALYVRMIRGEGVRFDLQGGERAPFARALRGPWDGTLEPSDKGVAVTGDRALIHLYGRLCAVSLQGDGAELWRVEVPDILHYAALRVVDDVALLFAGEFVGAFSLEDGRQLWDKQLVATGCRVQEIWGHPAGLLTLGGDHKAALIAEKRPDQAGH